MKKAPGPASADARHTACPVCRTVYYFRLADLGLKSICRQCGRPFYLLPPSANPPTVALSDDWERNEELSALVGRLWLDFRPGQIVDGEFLIIRPIGQGGLSQIFQTLDIRRKTPLALKAPLADTLDRLAPEIFINEAAAWLKPAPHPNLIGCDQVRILNGQPLIFMEYIDGQDLSHLAADGRGILYQGPPRSSCLSLLDIFIQAARGLDYAHSQGLTNLDIKPRNILVDRGGRALIGDYGHLSAGHFSSLESASLEMEEARGPDDTQETKISGTRLLGTPQYFSPEAIAGRLVSGAAADLWALALTILECFLGRRPWEVGSLAGQALEGYLAEPVHPTFWPPALGGYFRRALAADPHERFSEASQVERLLTEIYAETAGQPYGRPPARPAEETPERLAGKNAAFMALGRLDLCREP